MNYGKRTMHIIGCIREAESLGFVFADEVFNKSVTELVNESTVEMYHPEYGRDGLIYMFDVATGWLHKSGTLTGRPNKVDLHKTKSPNQFRKTTQNRFSIISKRLAKSGKRHSTNTAPVRAATARVMRDIAAAQKRIENVKPNCVVDVSIELAVELEDVLSKAGKKVRVSLCWE